MTLIDIPNVYVNCLNLYIESMEQHFREIESYFGTNRLIILHHIANQKAMTQVKINSLSYNLVAQALERETVENVNEFLMEVPTVYLTI